MAPGPVPFVLDDSFSLPPSLPFPFPNVGIGRPNFLCGAIVRSVRAEARSEKHSRRSEVETLATSTNQSSLMQAEIPIKGQLNG